MPERRQLKFSTEQDVIADVEHLRREGYEQVGEWSLPRACWHMSRIIDATTKPAPAGATATPDQAAKKAWFMNIVLKELPTGIPAPMDAVPPPRVELTAVDEFIEKTQLLANLPHKMVYVDLFGPATEEEIRRLHLAHAAHHLSFFGPQLLRKVLHSHVPKDSDCQSW